MFKNAKNFILSGLVCTFVLYTTILPLMSFCYEPVQTVTITKQDIINANPTPADVKFSTKDLKAIEMMERRHFTRTYPEFSDKQRLKNLEFELLGKTWQFSEQEDRIKTLKIASTNTMIRGTALPPSLNSAKNAKRMASSVPLRQRDDVGLIDGFLRLISPEKYKQYRMYSENMWKYND